MTTTEELIPNNYYVLVVVSCQKSLRVEFQGTTDGYYNKQLYIFKNIGEPIGHFLNGRLIETNEQFMIDDNRLNDKKIFIIEEYYEEDYVCK